MVTHSTSFIIIATLAASWTVQGTLVNEIHELVARQTSGSTAPAIDPSLIPAQCKDSCLPLNDLTNGVCTTVDCICGSRISGSVSGCLQCALNFSQLSSFVGQCQTIYDNYASNCKTAGKPVPPFVFKLDDNPSPSDTSGTDGHSGGSASPSSGGSPASPSSGGSSGSSNSGDNGGGLLGKASSAPQRHGTSVSLAGALGAAVLLAI